MSKCVKMCQNVVTDTDGKKVKLLLFSRGTSWAPLGAAWAPLSFSWAPLGASWVPLGGSWGHLGRLWGALGRLWAALGRREQEEMRESLIDDHRYD